MTSDVILISNGTILTMDKGKRVFEKGSIVIEKDRILDVGETDCFTKEYKADIEIDATDKAVLPGLINAHAHTWFNLFRNLRDDMTITDLIPKIMLPILENIEEEEIYIGALLSFVEMIKSGTTCFLDNPPLFVKGKASVEKVVQAMEKMGIRGIIAPGVWPEQDVGEAVYEYTRLIEKWHGKLEGRLQIWPSPMLLIPKELVKALSDLAREHGVGFTTHLAETNEQVKEVEEKYGNRQVPYLADLGILGPNFVGSHSIWLMDDEIRQLAESGSKIVYAPGSVMLQGSGIASIVKMLKYGVTVGLGSNGAAFNADMFEEMRLAAEIQRGYNLDPTCLSARKVLEMATIDGAKTLLLNREIGSIEKGKKADLIFVDIKNPHTIPRHDIVQSLVYGASSRDVSTVIIDGNLVMKDRIIQGVNEKEIVDKAENVAKKLVERALPPALYRNTT